jgi:hypothetical protein
MNWYADSRATYYITNELNKLAVRDKYNGAKKVHMPSGAGTEISHTGKSFIHTPTRNLELCNILHVPKVTKKIFYLFVVLLWITIFSLKYTIGSFSLRIMTRGALYLRKCVMTVYTLY